MFLYKLIVIAFVIGFYACNGDFRNKERKSEHVAVQVRADTTAANGKLDAMFDKRQLVFKRWLVDTLAILNRFAAKINKPSKNVKQVIEVASDSSQLSITNYYDMPVNADLNRIIDCRNLCFVLKKANEYPTSPFALKLETSYYFSPSLVPQLPYDLDFNFENIQIMENNGQKISDFKINRATIREKTVTTSLENGQKKVTNIEFLWIDKKLVKKEIK